MDKQSLSNAPNGGSTDKEPETAKANLTAKDGLFIATECHLALFPDEDGDTALHLAAVQGDLEACRKLVELFGIAGKSIDVQNNLLQTPLHVAVITNNKDIVDLLVSKGSDPNNPDRYGSTAIHLCAKFDHPDCFVEILKHIWKPALLNARDYEGQTALHVAVLNRSKHTFRLLITKGADIDAKDNKGGRTPLIYAIEKNEKEFVEALLERDASVSQQTYSGDTALHIASGRGLQDIVRLLLRRGADANMKNTHFETPMSLATSPMLSDMLRNQYVTIQSDSKIHTTIEPQFHPFITRSLVNPPPKHFYKISTDQLMSPKRTLNLKTERPMLEYDGPPPSKRLHLTDGMKAEPASVLVAPTSVNGDMRVEASPNKIVVKHEFVDPSFDGQTARPFQPNEPEKDNVDEDLECIKASDSFEEHVEITMEEVELSAEEEVATRSDEDEKTDDSQSPPMNQEDKKPVEQPYTHKLMQYSSNLSNKSITTTVAAKITNGKTNLPSIETKPVIVQRQPQIDSATALKRELKTTLDGHVARSPVQSPAFTTKSKSVPNSPQPAEANLYQLAREGLAVAAMANSANAQLGSNRDFGLSNYLKARPSRQAKIKSGTEELQNLALQGLAVAAMNAQAESSAANLKRKKVSDDIDEGKVTISIETNQLQSVLPEPQPPLLLRSNSMPPKQYFEKPVPPFIPSQTHTVSSNALLALAHANARKEHVGQAISAISMGKSQVQGIPTGKPLHHVVAINNNTPISSAAKTIIFPPGKSRYDVMDSTKQNLRQAIMVKSTNTSLPHQLQHQNSCPGDIDKKKFGFKQEVAVGKIQDNATKAISVKFVQASDSNSTTGPSTAAVTSKETTVSVVAMADKASMRSKTPERVAVFNVKIPRTVDQTNQNYDSTVIQTKPSTEVNGRNVVLNLHPAQNVSSRNTRESAPTHTVAPLHITTTQNTSFPKSDSGNVTNVVSVPTAPIVTYRVSTPLTMTVQASRTSVAENTATMASHHVSSLPPACTTSTSVAPFHPVALGVQHPQILSQTAFPIAQASTSLLRPQIAYIPHGKDFIPVILPPSALPPQLQFPAYATLQAQVATQSSEKSKTVTEEMVSNSNSQLDEVAYINSLTKIPGVGPNLLRFPVPLQDPRAGYYPGPPTIYSAHPQLEALQQQQLIRNALLYQHQSLLAHARLPAAQGVLTNNKPVAAVSAVPVKVNSVTTLTSEDQPLNLSIKSEPSRSNAEQPLNLMKSQDSSARGSVIKSALSSQIDSSSQKPTATDSTGGIEQHPATSQQRADRPAQEMYLPPPVIINPAAVANSAGLSPLSLPPIHYVDGMPLIYSVQPQI